VAEVQTIAVIGAGRVGRGIAQAAARGGFRTILEDLLPNALRRAESEIRSQLDWAVGRAGFRPTPPVPRSPVWNLPAVSKTPPARLTW
jgi:3-hydroxyacyl-CoA dehydrogenase